MSLNLDNIATIFNPDIQGAKELAQKICSQFACSNIHSIYEMPKTASFVIVVGGDGTILKCARKYTEQSTPIFGFNMGRLGFLAQAMPDEIEKVCQKIKNGDFRIENRIMLESSNLNLLALNDIVIKGETFSRTSRLNLFINDIKLCSYLADGLIISTPTGSSAYSLSAGGPIITPGLECFAIVPICPHTLNARPIIIPSSEKIKITTTSKNSGFQVSFDGQEGKTIETEVSIQRHQKEARLLLLNDDNGHFYDILRQKLHWGVAPNKL